MKKKILMIGTGGTIASKPVSYTHLDVYKRQLVDMICTQQHFWGLQNC